MSAWRIAVSISAALFLFCIAPYTGLSQQKPEKDSNKPVEKDYSVGPKDVITVEVWGEDMKITSEVSSDGTIQFFFLGQIQVAGLNTSQIKEKIENELKSEGYLNDPVVIVKIEEYKSKEVQIHGAIKDPGIYYLDTNYTTLLNLISRAGGTSKNRGKLAYVWRGGANQVTIPQNKSDKDETGDSSAGDKKKTIKSEAEIRGSLQGTEKIEVNILNLLDKGDVSENVRIYPGDFVLINSLTTENLSQNYVWVEGEVKSPEQIPYQPGLTVLQAVIKTGGVTDLASPNRTQITRRGPDGENLTFKVKLKDIQQGERPDVVLQPGDRIYVPESWW
ncbi:MAG: polysaccharide biosynthesis/export family protein [bacterium]